jgi:hypothetical protein
MLHAVRLHAGPDDGQQVGIKRALLIVCWHGKPILKQDCREDGSAAPSIQEKTECPLAA